MRVVATELVRVRVPLREPFVTASGTLTERDVVLVRVLTDLDTEGWGECSALPAPTYTAEYTAGAWAVLHDVLLPRVVGQEIPDGEVVARLLDPVAGHPMAKAAIEVAVLDALLRAQGRSLAVHLGATARAVPVGVAVGVTSSVDALLAAVTARVEEGYARVKLKILPGWDVEPVRAVRSAWPHLALQVDANGSYTLDEALVALQALDAFELVLVEQPLPADDLLGHAALQRHIVTPICLDESITSLGTLRTALALDACRVVNLKLARVGGLAVARAIHDECRTAGISLWCGGMLETGIGRAAALALAALPGFDLPADLSASDRYYERDLTDPFVLGADSTLAVPTGPGLGVAPSADALAAITVSRTTVR